MSLGVNMLVEVGVGAVVLPLGLTLTGLIEQVEVTDVADGQSGFRITFSGERSSSGFDYAVLADGRMEMFNRVRITVAVGSSWSVLIDGLITNVWLDPGRNSGARVVVSGQDLSAAMDREEVPMTWPGMNEADIVTAIIAKYVTYAIGPDVDTGGLRQSPTMATPVQSGTDLAYIYELADRFGYVFKIFSGTPNVAYWGPGVREALPAPALSIDTGTLGNVNHLTFTNDGTAATVVTGAIQDPTTGIAAPVAALNPALPPLARSSAFLNPTLVRKVALSRASGLGESQAMMRAEGIVRRSAMRVVRGEGEVSALAYGGVLAAGKTIGVRGAGANFDGEYLVERVAHMLERGKYVQAFTIARDGTGALAPVVRP